ncbi:hypothetical protein [Bathymodiolus japonicus methanotrophic gill symbiont]|uniref:hypothetical protein n=1 Tax=Bathymodiolus japonicus methanotrophic gill symbiont TaxID=113269 RepID=UPI001C8E9233|nr:hypothetical protein [Bathymodiolus japonicus methanotrophic gill symbiont]
MPCRLSGTKNHHFAKLRFPDFQRTHVAEDMRSIQWLLFFTAFPFSFIGADNTYDRLAEHAYQDFVKKGAFSGHR